MKYLTALLGGVVVYAGIFLFVYLFAKKEIYGLTLRRKSEQYLLLQSEIPETEAAPGESPSFFFASWQILTVTGLSSAIFAVSILLHPALSAIMVLKLAAFVICMTLLAFTDALCMRVPNAVLRVMLFFYLGLGAIQILLSPEEGLSMIGRGLGGALFAGGSFLLCYLITRGKLGGGDVKLSFLMGLYLGGPNIGAALIGGMVLNCLYAVVLLCMKKIKLSDGIPLVPFLYLGVLITLLQIR